MIFQLGRYTIDVDVEKTKDFYASAVASNEICSCPCCQYFPNAIMSCSTIIVDFLNNLGVDPQSPEKYLEISIIALDGIILLVRY